MQDRDLYQRMLGLTSPWTVTDVRLDLPAQRVLITVAHEEGKQFPCPQCKSLCPVYDHRRRQWRHLDTMQLKTIMDAPVPRISCKTHGIVQVHLPWAEPGSGFTALFEAVVISWLAEASISAVAKHLSLSWDEVDGIMQRAVDRGLSRRTDKPIKHLGIDETSYQKRHEYVTVLLDRDRNVVLDVIDDRTKEGILGWMSAKSQDFRHAIQTVTMDMWQPYIQAIRETLPKADRKICFDRFHVAQHFNRGLDIVRAQEHRRIRHQEGESPLTRTKHHWLRTGQNIDNRSRRDFMALTRSNLKTARAWAMKETATQLWNFIYRGAAESAWKRLIGWTDRCQLPPMKKVGNLVREHLWGILNAVIERVSNAAAEAKNAGIQKIKARACGFRNRERFRRAILFHFGGLDLLPAQAASFIMTHPED